MEIRRFVVGPFEVNSYLLDSEAGSGAWYFVDPGYPEPDLVAAVRARADRPGWVMLTHGHFDHVAGIPAVVKSAPRLRGLWVRRGDRTWLADPANAWPPDYPALDPAFVAGPDWNDMPDDNDEIVLDGIRFRIVAAPGHTPGGAVIWHEEEGWALTGDTIFRGSVGRVDLPGGSAADLIRTLRQRLTILPDETRLLPGHGPETTMVGERRTNPYLVHTAELLGEEP